MNKEWNIYGYLKNKDGAGWQKNTLSGMIDRYMKVGRKEEAQNV
ncbi:hypothetical protein CLOHYLEM_03999 [[Clostridium] hylemonae DSM 15053]|uniref:Uncharacterized protein n=1 Tax=[Clostridium] hylemonae DSM 15053 TaxID=553973 RepID=C0BW01_9FIRM|nr:hypothetical protein CLOHYLEM_03999 [[Clostridium] hylemonae DSM 15053]